MKPLKRKVRPVLKVPGGQAYAARWIIGHFPDHSEFCEPFGGGLSVFLNKPVCAVEWVGELNAHLVNLYVVLGDVVLRERFLGILGSVVYCLGVFERARFLLRPEPSCLGSVRDAVLFYIVRRMSVNGEGKRFSWSVRLRGGRPGDLNGWETMMGVLPGIGGRFELANIFCGRALDLIEVAGSSECVVYCDPTFPHETRSKGSRKMYGRFEMSDRDHVELLDLLLVVPARGVFVSTYENALYSRVLGGAGWDCDVLVLPNHMSGEKVKGTRRAELWWRM